MFFRAANLDDALRDTIFRLLKGGKRIRTSKGKAREFTSVLVEIGDPRARFSRTEGRGALLSYIGETLWYLAGSDRLDHIEYYIPTYRTFIDASPRAVRAPGAYGPRLFGGKSPQMTELLRSLQKKMGKSDTRQAVAQIFARADLSTCNGDVPCTTTLQFLPRKGRLNMITSMRSNDVYRGFPGDVFAFTFIQELVATTLGLEVGKYSHFVGSLHLYDTNEAPARDYLNEGFQSPMSMPAMPFGDPWPSIAWLLAAEQAIRLRRPEPSSAGIAPYWLDLARLLRIKVIYKDKDMRQLAQIKNEMSSPVFDAYIRGRQIAATQWPKKQPELPGISAGPQGITAK